MSWAPDRRALDLPSTELQIFAQAADLLLDCIKPTRRLSLGRSIRVHQTLRQLGRGEADEPDTDEDQYSARMRPSGVVGVMSP